MLTLWREALRETRQSGRLMRPRMCARWWQLFSRRFGFNLSSRGRFERAEESRRAAGAHHRNPRRKDDQDFIGSFRDLVRETSEAVLRNYLPFLFAYDSDRRVLRPKSERERNSRRLITDVDRRVIGRI